MQKRVKDLVRKLRSVVELHAISAPHTLPYDQSLRCWWSYPENLWDGRGESIQALAENLLQLDTFPHTGLQRSVELVLSEFLRGEYDGILGFSQGAILATIVCAELQRRGSKACRFAVLVSGFGKPVPGDLDVYPLEELLQVPSLHVWGLLDDHIPPAASEVLESFFVAPRRHVHQGAHFVPQKAADCQVFLEFFSQFATLDVGVPLKQLAGASAEVPDGALAVSFPKSVEVPRSPGELATSMAFYSVGTTGLH